MTLVSTVLLAAATQLMAQSVTSGSIGFNKVTCLNNSDTIVGVPFRAQGSLHTKLAAAPVVSGDVATLTLIATHLPLWPAHRRYVKFNSGGKDGRYYDITSNTDTTVTLDLNGDTLGDATTGDALVIAEYWTLGTLFPASGATTAWTETPAASGNWVQNGHAIMASTSVLPSGRRSEILFYNLAAVGTDISVQGFYFIHAGIWKLSNGGATDRSNTVFPPDAFFAIRHGLSVPFPTIFKSVGEVEAGKFTIPLSTRTTGSQDTLIGLPRPVGVTLNQLGLKGSDAFVASTSVLPSSRRDQVLVYSSETQLRNKTPAAIYFVHGGIWKLTNGGAGDRGAVVIPAGEAFVIRKYQTLDGSSAFWLNHPSY